MKTLFDYWQKMFTPQISLKILVPSVFYLLVILIITAYIFPKNQSSDSYYLLALYEDIMVDGYDISQWNFTPAPYFFPDAFVLFPLLMVMPDYGLAMAAYNVIFWFTLVFATTWIGVKIGFGKVHAFWASVSSLLLCQLALLPYVAQGLPGYVFLPTFHTGCLFYGILYLCWCLYAYEHSPKIWQYGLFLILNIVMMFSDLLFGAQVLLPIMITLLIASLLLQYPWRRSLAIGLISCAGMYGGYWLHYYIDRHDLLKIPSMSFETDSYTRQTWEAMQNFYVAYLDVFGTIKLFPLVLLVIIASVGCSIFLLSKKSTDSPIRKHYFIFQLIFVMVSILSTFFALCITGLWNTFWESRYFLNLYIMPFWVMAWALLIINQLLSRKTLLISMLIIVAFGWGLLAHPIRSFQVSNLSLPYPNWLHCLDTLAARYGLEYGYGDYWNSKFINIGSKQGLRVNQMHANMVPDRWINNDAWYLTPESTYPHYTFIITERLPEDQLLAVFGEPALRHQCDTKIILLYNRPTDIAFRNYFKAHANHGALVHKPTAPKELVQYKGPYTDWTYQSARLYEGQTLTVEFVSPINGQFLEISADNNDAYRVAFHNATQDKTGEITIPPASGSGLMPRYVNIPEQARTSGISTLKITPIEGDGNYSVGHVFIYD